MMAVEQECKIREELLRLRTAFSNRSFMNDTNGYYIEARLFEEGGIEAEKMGNMEKALLFYQESLSVFEHLRLIGEGFRVAQRIGDPDLIEEWYNKLKIHFVMDECRRGRY